MVYVASVFKVLQSCGASTALAGKCYVTRSFVKCNVFMSQSFRCGSHKFIAFKTTKQVSAAQIGLHNCSTSRNKTSTNFNKFIHIVTLGHNTCKKHAK